MQPASPFPHLFSSCPCHLTPQHYSALLLVINDPPLILASFLKSLATTVAVSLPETLLLAQACCQ